MIEPVEVFFETGKSPDEAKEVFCDRLLEEMAKMKGKDLAPYLSDMVLDRKRKTVKIILSLPVASHEFNGFVGEVECNGTGK